MRGLKCRDCDGNRCAKPYITAYEIAVKHGFQGTEEEWIKSIGNVWVLKVETRSGSSWTCDTTFEEIETLRGERELHLLTLDGRIAIMNGKGLGSITFCTPPYGYGNLTVYEDYLLEADDTGTCGVYSTGSEAIPVAQGVSF